MKRKVSMEDRKKRREKDRQPFTKASTEEAKQESEGQEDDSNEEKQRTMDSGRAKLIKL